MYRLEKIDGKTYVIDCPLWNGWSILYFELINGVSICAHCGNNTSTQSANFGKGWHREYHFVDPIRNEHVVHICAWSNANKGECIQYIHKRFNLDR